MDQTFRLKKSVKYLGIFCAAIYLAAVIGSSSIFFLEEPAKHGFRREHSVAVLGGAGLIVFGTMLLMSIYFWIAYYVERFTISGTSLSNRSVFQNHQFHVAELQCLTWRVRPFGGSIIVRFRGAKSRLDFYGFANDDRLRIITALHDLVPAPIHEGWPEFCHKIALPLGDAEAELRRAPVEPSSGDDIV